MQRFNNVKLDDEKRLEKIIKFTVFCLSVFKVSSTTRKEKVEMKNENLGVWFR